MPLIVILSAAKDLAVAPIVILSAAKDLRSTWREILSAAKDDIAEQDDKAESASFDLQHVFFERYWPFGAGVLVVAGVLVGAQEVRRQKQSRM